MTKQLTFSRETLLEQLKEGPCIVEFEKKDGSIRKMRCSRAPADITAASKGETQGTKREKTPNPDQISVVDLDKLSWRSFMIDSIISFTVEPNDTPAVDEITEQS